MEELYLFQDQLIRATDFLFRRNFMDEIEWNERLIGIIGAKGVGKTTLMLQHLIENTKQRDETLYVTVDNVSMSVSSLFSLAQNFVKSGGKRLYIDEIHKYPNWAAELKNIYDLLPKLKVVFSGYSLIKILSEKADLSRRAVLFHVAGLSFREFLQIIIPDNFPVFSFSDILNNHESITIQLSGKFKPLQYFNRYLKTGYYPFFLQSESTYVIKLNSTLNYVIENEIAAIIRSDYKTIRKFKRLLQMIASNVPFQPNISKLAESLELNRNTLLNYLHLMDSAEIIHSVYNYGSFYGKLSKPEKIFLAHPNHYNSLEPIRPDLGSIRESFFVNQIKLKHKIECSPKADFIVDDKYSFEIGGHNKSKRQISGLPESYLVVDDLEVGFKNKIPLWLFGFLY